MQDIDIIYEYLSDLVGKGENDPVRLELTVKKIASKEFAIGLLVELCIKPDEYGISKESALGILGDIAFGKMDDEFAIKCHSEYIDAMVAKTEATTGKLESVKEALLAMMDHEPGSIELDEVLGKMSLVSLSFLKEKLLESEVYEFIAQVDKHIEAKK